VPQAGLNPRPRAVLFDLDGTLIDSAPDLAGACNEMRVERGLAEMPYERLRRMVGSGARGMVGAAFGLAPGDDGYEALRDEFLRRYESRMTRETCVFADVAHVLAWLDAEGLVWGIVTNKATRFTAPIVAGLGLAQRAAVVVCGDTTPHSKPHPEPLWHAARAMGLAPADVVYVGDDLRDAQAAKAAGMPMVVATWGYLGLGESVHDWGADALADAPDQLSDWLRERAN
jgi:2-phosphoglycolate phosphatase